MIAQTHITGNHSATRRHYIRGEQTGDLKYDDFFLCESWLPMPRGRHRASFDQVSEFIRGGIVVYRDCGLSFTEIGRSVGRNQTTNADLSLLDS
ncbi:hypothetical protein TNCV_2148171 [Trichonephila clavipes]|uniref:Uncharacterized protein n=1 Tax=Trichonephila clavipes TaxID=2585209 RepID=A0A8X6VS35_TRICX|nr:hypothetical protein TNCV_2148171 [Trichonephila clavipes]